MQKAAITFFTLHKEIAFKKNQPVFQGIYYHTFQYPNYVTLVSFLSWDIHKAAMLQLPIVGNLKLWWWRGHYKYNIYSKFPVKFVLWLKCNRDYKQVDVMISHTHHSTLIQNISLKKPPWQSRTKLNSTSVQITSPHKTKFSQRGKCLFRFSTASYPASSTYLNSLFNLECLKGGCKLPWYEGNIWAERHFMLRQKLCSLSPD